MVASWSSRVARWWPRGFGLIVSLVLSSAGDERARGGESKREADERARDTVAFGVGDTMLLIVVSHDCCGFDFVIFRLLSSWFWWWAGVGSWCGLWVVFLLLICTNSYLRNYVS